MSVPAAASLPESIQQHEYYATIMEFRYPLIVALIIFVTHAVDKMKATKLENLHMDAMYTKFLMSIFRLVAYIVALSRTGAYFGLQMDDFWGTLVTSGSVIIGLASQDVLSNFAHGVVLILTRPFEVGDVISVGGVTGKVVAVKAFSTRLVTSNNEGVQIPNGQVIGAALQNNSENYTCGAAPNLREVDIPIRIPVTVDLEKAIAVLEKAAKTCEEGMTKLITDPKKKSYPNGTHTIEEYFRIKHGQCIKKQHEKHPPEVFVGGQELGAGHYLELRMYTDQTLYWDAFQLGYRTAVKALKAADIPLYTSP